MNIENTNKLLSVINALNNTEVKGKINLMNISGSIAVLEDMYQSMIDEQNTKQKESKKKE